MSTADAALIALGERFERRLLEYMDAWLAWAPLMRAARAEAESDLAGFTVAIQRNGSDAAQARMSELENDMQALAEEIIAAPATGDPTNNVLPRTVTRGRAYSWAPVSLPHISGNDWFRAVLASHEAGLATDADGQDPALQAEGLMAALGCSTVRR
jgi:hypothetical protein